ncbi:methionine ABC transporter permease, partial [Streptococcus agalactiae]
VQTLYMTFWSFLIGGLMGLLGGLFLVLTSPRGVIANKLVFGVLDKVVSVFRALPFIILLALIAPVTRVIVGTTLGSPAALVPLSLAVFPFFARQVQVVLAELDGGVIEAAQASGGTLWDIIVVYLREGLPDLIRVSTVTLISLVGETAMAGAIGAGGLGSVAITKGYNYSRDDITLVATILILLLIFFIQFLGDFLTRRLSHK